MNLSTNKHRGVYRIRGRVQGVGFRYFVYKKAISLGLTGYVKNLFDGDVEVIAEGSQQLLSTLLDYLKQGPPMSRVEFVETDYRIASGEYLSFEIR